MLAVIFALVKHHLIVFDQCAFICNVQGLLKYVNKHYGIGIRHILQDLHFTAVEIT